MQANNIQPGTQLSQPPDIPRCDVESAAPGSSEIRRRQQIQPPWDTILNTFIASSLKNLQKSWLEKQAPRNFQTSKIELPELQNPETAVPTLRAAKTIHGRPKWVGGKFEAGI